MLDDRRKPMSSSKVLLQVGLAVVGVASLLAACKSVETTPPTGPAYPTETSFCKALAEAVCNSNVVGACYGSSDASLPDDTTSCREQYARAANCNPGSFDYHSTGAEACIGAMKKAYADAKLTVEDRDAMADACLPVFSRGGPVGSPCDIDSDCDGAATLRCVVKPGQAGSCQEPELIGPGLSCVGPAQLCEEGFYCGSDAACIERPAAGQACDDAKPCVEQARCIDLMCVAKTPNGGACQQDGQCLEGFCIKASGATDGTCAAQLTLSPTTDGSCSAFLP